MKKIDSVVSTACAVGRLDIAEICRPLQGYAGL